MSILIRNTTTFECGIDRRVDRAGHGDHGGWSLSQGAAVICFCGERLFELADLNARPDGGNPAGGGTGRWRAALGRRGRGRRR